MSVVKLAINMVFPLFKLGILFSKTLMKPVTGGLTRYARRSPRFSRNCHWLAENYFGAHNRFCRILRIPYQARTSISEEEAVELGAGLLGEASLLGGAAGLVYWEYYRSHRHPSPIELLERRVEDLEKSTGTGINSYKDRGI